MITLTSCSLSAAGGSRNALWIRRLSATIVSCKVVEVDGGDCGEGSGLGAEA